MSNIAFNCPGCEQQLETPADMGGETVECPQCGQQMVVPELPKESATLDDISFGGDTAAPPPDRSDVSLEDISFGGDAETPAAPDKSEATLDDISFGDEAPASAPAAPDVFEKLAAEQAAPPEPEPAPEPPPEVEPEPEPDAANTCPECGADMAPGAVLCLGCGFHTGTGKKISTELG